MVRSAAAALVLCTGGLAWRDGGGAVGVAVAAVPPSASPSAPWRAWNGGYRRDEDIPVMGDRSRRSNGDDGDEGIGSTKGRTRRRRFRRRNRRRELDDDAPDSSDEGAPPLSFLDRDFDDAFLDQRRRRRRRQQTNNQPLDPIRQWAMEKTGVHIPRINLHCDPVTILKIRKSLPDVIPGAIIRVGADFQTHRLGKGLWRVRGCIEDKLLGGRFTIRERKSEDDRSILMEYSKSWLFAGSGGAGTRLNLSAAYDVNTARGSVRFGFRTESTNAVGSYQMMPGRKGFSVVPVIPLERDGTVLLEAKANVELPDSPEFIIGTDFDGAATDGATLGMGIGGDINVDVEEVNLIFLL